MEKSTLSKLKKTSKQLENSIIELEKSTLSKLKKVSEQLENSIIELENSSDNSIDRRISRSKFDQIKVMKAVAMTIFDNVKPGKRGLCVSKIELLCKPFSNISTKNKSRVIDCLMDDHIILADKHSSKFKNGIKYYVINRAVDDLMERKECSFEELLDSIFSRYDSST